MTNNWRGGGGKAAGRGNRGGGGWRGGRNNSHNTNSHNNSHEPPLDNTDSQHNRYPEDNNSYPPQSNNHFSQAYNYPHDNNSYSQQSNNHSSQASRYPQNNNGYPNQSNNSDRQANSYSQNNSWRQHNNNAPQNNNHKSSSPSGHNHPPQNNNYQPFNNNSQDGFGSQNNNHPLNNNRHPKKNKNSPPKNNTNYRPDVPLYQPQPQRTMSSELAVSQPYSQGATGQHSGADRMLHAFDDLVVSAMRQNPTMSHTGVSHTVNAYHDSPHPRMPNIANTMEAWAQHNGNGMVTGSRDSGSSLGSVRMTTPATTASFASSRGNELPAGMLGPPPHRPRCELWMSRHNPANTPEAREARRRWLEMRGAAQMNMDDNKTDTSEETLS
ncbi:hypothetical protein QBC46DRAFT_449936 [Diplogelasinospora grovesii]|uniref:Uncharacterized protein n=1 Tax=Diplogelasinospora grovesii TaxID=303347 RepID=A0AAN6NA39_9PEZI|nr:hypothetical protein QBC46DRAFT_449936 [Diplogelasinospora grovesii]